MKRILALDGGGIRGVFTLQILAKIEVLFRQERNNDKLVLADVFDFIAGTSTGAIIAAFLSWGLSVGDIEKLYIDHSPEMFAKTSLAQRWKTKYRSDAIARFFRERFVEADGTPALLGTHKLRTLLLIVTRNGSTGSAWPVSNNPQALYNERSQPDCNLNFPLWQLLRASTAAPWYFPPEEIKIAGQKHLFVDGGMSPYNNPTLIAAAFATLPCYRICWEAKREELHVVSVGTGLVPDRMPGKAAASIHVKDYIEYAATALIGAAAWEQDLLCRVIGDCVHGAVLDSEIGALETPTLLTPQEQKFTYCRYNERLDAAHPRIKQLPGGKAELDDLKLIPFWQELGKDYAQQHVRGEHLYPRTDDFSPCPCSVTK